MNTRLLWDSLGWGFILWLIGYVLGFLLFFVVPVVLLGWAIMPIGVAITLWVLFKRVKAAALWHYLVLSVVWTALAMALDYLLIVKALKPADGYYKLDVYLYYAFTFLLPLAAFGWKARHPPEPGAGK